MTNKDLKDSGLTEEELSRKIGVLQREMEAGKLKFSSEVLTPQRKEGLKAIRTRASDGRVDLDSIDFDTALFIRAITKTYDEDPNAS